MATPSRKPGLWGQERRRQQVLLSILEAHHVLDCRTHRASASPTAQTRAILVTVRPNTTIRPDAFRGTACCGSDPTGHANSRVGSHFPLATHNIHPDRDHAHRNGTPRPVPGIGWGRILAPRVQCRYPEWL